MTSIEKILKHNIFFTYKKWGPYSGSFYRIYTSNPIYDLVSLNIANSIDFVEKLMPFLYYLASEYQERRNLNLFTFALSVEVLSRDEPLFSKTLFSTLPASF